MGRPSSDIDPRNFDVEPPRKRRRKNRTKPDPKPILKAGEQAAVDRAMARPFSPGVMLEPRGDGWEAEPVHNDRDLWAVQLADCFGTRSHAVMEVFLHDLRKLCPQAWDADIQRWKDSEVDLNAALAMVADWQPENTAQAALAAQLVALHWMMVRVSAQALNRGGVVFEKDAALAGKLARSYAHLCETMQALKGQRQTVHQTFKVEKTLKQEVRYYDQRGGGGPDCASRAHERSEPQLARIADHSAPVRGKDEGGVVVPLPSSARKK